MSVIKKVTNAVGLTQDAPRLETKVPAQQLTRESEVDPTQIQVGSDDDTGSSAKGKRALVRPVSSSLGGV